MPMTVCKFAKSIECERLFFDYPIQRSDEQWNLMQKSLLVHSLIADYPIPPIYTIAKVTTIDGKTANSYNVIDGKQRITNLVSYFKDLYALHVDTPPVNINGTYYNIGKLKFTELPEEVRLEFQTKTISMYYFSEITEIETVDLFYRLNNGTGLTVHQKNKAVMGVEASKELNRLSKHPFLTINAHFTPSQQRKNEEQVVLLQSAILFDQYYEWKSFASDELSKYALRLNFGELEVLLSLEKYMDMLHDVYGEEKDKYLLKKMHIPPLLYAMKHVEENGYSKQHLLEWLNLFSDTVRGVTDEIPTDYKEYAGAWAVKKVNVLGRIESIVKHLDTFYNNKRELVEVGE